MVYRQLGRQALLRKDIFKMAGNQHKIGPRIFTRTFYNHDDDEFRHTHGIRFGPISFCFGLGVGYLIWSKR